MNIKKLKVLSIGLILLIAQQTHTMAGETATALRSAACRLGQTARTLPTQVARPGLSTSGRAATYATATPFLTQQQARTISANAIKNPTIIPSRNFYGDSLKAYIEKIIAKAEADAAKAEAKVSGSSISVVENSPGFQRASAISIDSPGSQAIASTGNISGVRFGSKNRKKSGGTTLMAGGTAVLIRTKDTNLDASAKDLKIEDVTITEDANINANVLAKGFSVGQNLNVNGNISGKAFKINNILNVNGSCVISDMHVSGGAFVNGLLQAENSTFANLEVSSIEKTTLVNSTANSMVIKIGQQVELDNSTVNGDIIFEKEGGKVIARNGSKVTGSIIGGTLEVQDSLSDID